MRKKFIALLMCGLMISLAACGSGEDIGEVQNGSVLIDETYTDDEIYSDGSGRFYMTEGGMLGFSFFVRDGLV